MKTWGVYKRAETWIKLQFRVYETVMAKFEILMSKY